MQILETSHSKQLCTQAEPLCWVWYDIVSPWKRKNQSPESPPGLSHLSDSKLSEGQQVEGVTLRHIGRFKAHISAWAELHGFNFHANWSSDTFCWDGQKEPSCNLPPRASCLGPSAAFYLEAPLINSSFPLINSSFFLYIHYIYSESYIYIYSGSLYHYLGESHICFQNNY